MMGISNNPQSCNRGVLANYKRQKLEERTNAVLPDDIVSLILCKLPIKSLLRFKSLSKSWNSLIDDSCFIKQHSMTQCTKKLLENIMFISWLHKEQEIHLSFFSNDGCTYASIVETKGVTAKNFSVSNLCDGMICLNFGFNNVFLANPTIGEVIQLPKDSTSISNELLFCAPVGLIFDDSATEYKVVRLFLRRDNTTGCEIFTTGSTSWRQADDALLRPVYSSPVVLNGLIHWTVDQAQKFQGCPAVGISFNIKSETFQVLTHPKKKSSFGNNITLVELAGNLCLWDKIWETGSIDVWLLVDYKNQIWLKQYNFIPRVNEVRMMPYILGELEPVTLLDGKIVMACSERRFLGFYDTESKDFKLKSTTSATEFKVVYYSESLVSTYNMIKNRIESKGEMEKLHMKSKVQKISKTWLFVKL